ncbi:MAG TPA: hypothetical protein VFH36_06895 [Acidimicrobiales bacterium]|nr:hypothetical protein [Acidimicrobiales bacterium]
MGKASSSKKVARAARAGGRSSGSKQRNLLFPSVIGVIVLLGTGLIAFAANERKSEADIAPVANQDHWHAAIEISICGEPQPATAEFESRIGIHTHGDGVIHIHPFSDGGAGENATLGAYLEGAGIELTDSKLTIGDESWEEGEDDCDGEAAELIVAQWKDVQSTDENPALIRRDFGDIRFREDGEGYTIAFVPEGTTDIPKPESAAQLAELGAADAATATSVPAGEEPPEGSDTTAGEGTGTTEPADTSTTAPPEQ